MNRHTILWGATLVAVGVVLLLDRTGTVDAWATLAAWWPMSVVAAGVLRLVTRPRDLLGGTVLGLIGVALLVWTLQVTATAALVWPTLLIGAGVWLVLGRTVDARPAELVGDRDEVVAVFEDREVRVAGGFTRAVATAVFGDVHLDLLDAELTGSAQLTATAVFGDVLVRVPEDWRVTTSGPRLLGDLRVDAPRTPAPASGEASLELHAVALLGDVRVNRVARAGPPAVVS